MYLASAETAPQNAQASLKKLESTNMQVSLIGLTANMEPFFYS
jgi:hypothetical protein